MTALATLLGGGIDGGGPEDVILDHEARYWRRTAGEHGLHLHEQTLQCAVAAAALCGAADQNEAMALLAFVPGLRDQSEDARIRAARWLHDLYPPPADLPDPAERRAGERPYWGTLQPDLLAEHLVGRIARLRPDFIIRLLDGATGTPLAERTDTNVCLISRGAQLGPSPAFSVIRRNALITLVAVSGLPIWDAQTKS